MTPRKPPVTFAAMLVRAQRRFASQPRPTQAEALARQAIRHVAAPAAAGAANAG